MNLLRKPIFNSLSEKQLQSFANVCKVKMYKSALEPTTTLCFLKRIMDMLIGNSVVLSNGYEGKMI